MVKRTVTSIITVAVLMGSLVACSGSDSELAELRAELEELKKDQSATEEPPAIPDPTATPVPMALTVGEKSYMLDICNDTVGTDSDINFTSCASVIQKLNDLVSPFSENEKQTAISYVIAFWECKASRWAFIDLDNSWELGSAISRGGLTNLALESSSNTVYFGRSFLDDYPCSS